MARVNYLAIVMYLLICLWFWLLFASVFNWPIETLLTGSISLVLIAIVTTVALAIFLTKRLPRLG